jgi:orotidine-5'-phosphate decarboxylase
MLTAKQRLIVALDVPDSGRALALVKLLAATVGSFKVGLELFISQGPPIVRQIRAAGAEAIFLDLKLHDIPNTMRAAAVQAARLGVDLLTCHCEQTNIFHDLDLSPTRLLGITVLTSLSREDLRRQGFGEKFTRPAELAQTKARLALAAGCHGVVCSGHEAAAIRAIAGAEALVVCPGIRPALLTAHDQKRVMTPGQAIKAGASHIVVGRPIVQADDPLLAAQAIVNELQSVMV